MTPPFKHNLKIYQGASFDDLTTWKTGATQANAVPVDLTGCTARAHIRPVLESSVILMTLTTENGRIVLGGAAGTVLIVISDEDTALITWFEGVYDLELVFPDGTVRRHFVGTVTVSPEVTRA